MNKNCDLVLFLFGTFSLSRPLGFTLHFSCSKLVCGKNKGSPVALQHPCTVSTSTQHGNTWTHARFFPHASKCDNARGRTHRHLPQRLLSPQRSLQPVILVGQRSLQAAILVRSAIIALSLRPSANFTLLETHTPVFWYCLHPCRARALSPFMFIQQSTSLLSCLVGKNILRVILFEWVILFEKPTVIVLTGNYIPRVNVIKGSLYSRVYGTMLQ